MPKNEGDTLMSHNLPIVTRSPFKNKLNKGGPIEGLATIYQENNQKLAKINHK